MDAHMFSNYYYQPVWVLWDLYWIWVYVIAGSIWHLRLLGSIWFGEVPLFRYRFWYFDMKKLIFNISAPISSIENLRYRVFDYSIFWSILYRLLNFAQILPMNFPFFIWYFIDITIWKMTIFGKANYVEIEPALVYILRFVVEALMIAVPALLFHSGITL